MQGPPSRFPRSLPTHPTSLQVTQEGDIIEKALVELREKCGERFARISPPAEIPRLEALTAVSLGKVPDTAVAGGGPATSLGKVPDTAVAGGGPATSTTTTTATLSRTADVPKPVAGPAAAPPTASASKAEPIAAATDFS